MFFTGVREGYEKGLSPSCTFFFKIFYYIYLFLFVYLLCVCVCLVQRTTLRVGSPFHHVGPEYLTHDVRLGSKRLSMLSHFSSTLAVLSAISHGGPPRAA